MQKQSLLRQQAIEAAKNQDWKLAIEINQEILSTHENNIEAMNRLGLALLQNKDKKGAIKLFNKVISIDKSNIIANKHLNKIKNNQVSSISNFAASDLFIQEPGKAKVVELHRLAGKSILNKLCIGQKCQLVSKNRYISVADENGTHVGALPEDLSFRLSKFISRGNEYSCSIHSFNDRQCSVHIKETKTSKKNRYLLSFPSTRDAVSQSSQTNSSILLDDDIPFEIPNDKDLDESNIEEAMRVINSDD